MRLAPAAVILYIFSSYLMEPHQHCQIQIFILNHIFSLIVTGHIDKFLSWRAFIPLSRLTYGVYLIHLVILFWYYASAKALIDMSISQLVSLIPCSIYKMFLERRNVKRQRTFNDTVRIYKTFQCTGTSLSIGLIGHK